MSRKRRLVPQRTLYFAGCEGNGERAYAALVDGLATDRGLHVHVHSEPLNPGAGDPLELVKRAVLRLQHMQRKGAHYSHAAVFLDSDTAAQEPNRTRGAQKLAAQHELQLVWQEPNLEAVLLRHLDGCQHLRPDAARSLAELQRRWPEYEKAGITAQKLAVRIGYPQIVQAAEVEPELKIFLRQIGLL